jgi:hypothetical protein
MLAGMLFRFVIPISSGEVGINRVGKFLRERRNKVITNQVVKIRGTSPFSKLEGVRGDPWESVVCVQALKSELFMDEQLKKSFWTSPFSG